MTHPTFPSLQVGRGFDSSFTPFPIHREGGKGDGSPIRALILLLFLAASALPAVTPKVWVFLDSASSRVAVPAERQSALDTLVSRGFRKRHESRWQNGFSGLLDSAAIPGVRALPFVRAVREVARYRASRPLPSRAPLPRGASAFSYWGPNLEALQLMRVPQAVDNLGIIPRNRAGDSIKIAVFDSGFRTDLEVFAHFTAGTVLGQRDYVAGMIDTSILFDTTVADDSLDLPGQENHGTEVLSLIAGYRPGTFMGTAPFARFALVKTEYVSTRSGDEIEIVEEEDAWIEAVEWVVDSLKVDIITSSLGYHYDFTDGRRPYTAAELNGDSIMITRQADLAVKKGVMVFTAAGNEGDSGAASISAPADGRLVTAVGAVTPTGRMSSFTSYGPTGDGRTKPDLCAPGASIWIAHPDGGYYLSQGTSFATPLAAGACALLLQARPLLRDSPLVALSLLKQSAWIPSNVEEPARSDSRYGAGIINLQSALLWVREQGPSPGGNRLFQVRAPARGDSTYLNFMLVRTAATTLRTARLTLDLFSLSGQFVRRSIILWPGLQMGSNLLPFALKNGDGRRIGPGIYFLKAAYRDEAENEEWRLKLAVAR